MPRVYGPPAVYMLYTLDITGDLLREPGFEIFRLMPQAKNAMEQRVRELAMQGYSVRSQTSNSQMRVVTMRNKYRAVQVCCHLMEVK